MTVTQLAFMFPTAPPKVLKPVPKDLNWRDCTELAKPMGFEHDCFVSAELADELGDQALFDALWTACFSLSLDKATCVLFTLELDGKSFRFKAAQANNVVYVNIVGHAIDFEHGILTL